jgi:hypothetical protein
VPNSSQGKASTEAEQADQTDERQLSSGLWQFFGWRRFRRRGRLLNSRGLGFRSRGGRNLRLRLRLRAWYLGRLSFRDLSGFLNRSRDHFGAQRGD